MHRARAPDCIKGLPGCSDLHVGRPSDQAVDSWIDSQYGSVDIVDVHKFNAADALQKGVDDHIKADLPL
jgi:hypothetical protein